MANDTCFFSLLKPRWAGIQSACIQQAHPATLGLAVAGEGPRGVPTQPEVRLIGIIKKAEDGQEKGRSPSAGWGATRGAKKSKSSRVS